MIVFFVHINFVHETFYRVTCSWTFLFIIFELLSRTTCFFARTHTKCKHTRIGTLVIYYIWTYLLKSMEARPKKSTIMGEKLNLLAPLWSGTSFSEPTTCSRSALCTAAEVQIHLALKCELLYCYVLANIIKQLFATRWFLYNNVCPFSSVLSPSHISYHIM